MSRPVVVVGDVLLDIDVTGRVERICPDAPAPVLEVADERARPGGAALAATLAARSGADVTLVAPLADDEGGRRLAGLLADEGVRLLAVPWSGATPVKQRVRSGGHTLVRLDRGDRDGTIGELPMEARAAVELACAVLVSDYGRGATADPGLRSLVEHAAGRVPIVWDPHPRGAPPVAGVTLATPNRQEAQRLGIDVPVDGRSPLDAATASAVALVERWRARSVAVTLGEDGALLTYGKEPPLVVPAPAVEAGDTCGAGDAFAAAAAVALADGALPSEAVVTAVEAAAAFVAGGGAAGLADVAVEGASGQAPAPDHDADPLAVVRAVRARGGTVVATGGCFDLVHAGHVATLEKARGLGDCLVVCLNSDDSVARLKGPGRPLVGERDRARVLAALGCVDAVLVFDEDDPGAALRRLRPDVWVKGGDYAGTRLPEADVLDEWGGRVVVVPFLDGRSTTGLVHAAAGRTSEKEEA